MNGGVVTVAASAKESGIFVADENDLRRPLSLEVEEE